MALYDTEGRRLTADYSNMEIKDHNEEMLENEHKFATRQGTFRTVSRLYYLKTGLVMGAAALECIGVIAAFAANPEGMSPMVYLPPILGICALIILIHVIIARIITLPQTWEYMADKTGIIIKRRGKIYRYMFKNPPRVIFAELGAPYHGRGYTISVISGQSTDEFLYLSPNKGARVSEQETIFYLLVEPPEGAVTEKAISENAL